MSIFYDKTLAKNKVVKKIGKYNYFGEMIENEYVYNIFGKRLVINTIIPSVQVFEKGVNISEKYEEEITAFLKNKENGTFLNVLFNKIRKG